MKGRIDQLSDAFHLSPSKGLIEYGPSRHDGTEEIGTEGRFLTTSEDMRTFSH